MTAMKHDRRKPAFYLIDWQAVHAASETRKWVTTCTPSLEDVDDDLRKGLYAQCMFLGGVLLCPAAPIRAMRTEIARALAFGAEKYSADNWRAGMAWSRLHGSALRHYESFLSGELFDQGSGCLHLGNFASCCMFLHVYQRDGIGEDDI